MGEKQFVWDEISNGLTLGIQRVEDEQIKGHRKIADVIHAPDIYCPHSYLILNFHETLNQSEKIKFRKYYLRKVAPNEPDIVILQDIKDLVIFLLITPVSPQFINFFHLPIVDRFLRALIIYFQSFVKIWDELVQERAATMKKAQNPLARGHRSRYAKEIKSLRCILGREYADLILGCQDHSQYHHMSAKKKGSFTAVTRSQGEKDLRIFETLIYMAHRVVWIALRRKWFNLIEVELHRLLRTASYNTAERRSNSHLVHDMLEDDIRILHEQTMQVKRTLLKNTPLIQELVDTVCDYRLLSLGIKSKGVSDPQIIYLSNALLAKEDKLSELGIKIGILGQSRTEFDVMLIPNEDINEGQILEKDEKHQSIFADTEFTNSDENGMGFPMSQSNFNSPETSELLVDSYKNVREEARRKWIKREILRRNKKQLDVYSIMTTSD